MKTSWSGVAVAPEAWPVELARRVGVPVGYAIRGRVGGVA